MQPRPVHRNLLIASLSLVLLAVVWTAAGQIPDQFTNLQVLPRDVSKKDLVDTMKGFSFGLGARCWYCHEGEGDDLSTFDFSSDKKAAKETARQHYQMTQEINEKYFAGRQALNCMTCHQGQAKPAS